MSLVKNAKKKATVKMPRKTLDTMFREMHEGVTSGRIRFSDARERMERWEDDEPGIEGKRRWQETRDKGLGPLEPVRTDPSRWHDPREAKRDKGGASKMDRKVVQKLHDRIIQTPPQSHELGVLESDEEVRMRKRLHDLHDGMALCVSHLQGYNPYESPYWPEYEYLSKALVNKILTTQSGGASTGTGGDFIPNTLSGQMTELFRLETLLAGIIPTINMPTSPFRLPLEGADVLPYYVTEGSDENAGTHSADAYSTRTAGTGKNTFTAKKHAVRAMITEESSEDSIVSTVDYSRRKLVQALANGREDCLINGDTSSTHQDSDVTTATDHRKAWDGLRFLTNAAATSSAASGKLTALGVLTLLTTFGKFSARPNDTAIVTGPVGMLHLMADANVITVDKLGARATLLTGQFASILGRPVILSGFIREDLTTSGVYDGSTTNRTMAIVFHRPSFAIGDRRAIMVESARDIYTGKFVVVASVRADFQRLQAESTGNRNVGYVYNINTAATFS